MYTEEQLVNSRGYKTILAFLLNYASYAPLSCVILLFFIMTMFIFSNTWLEYPVTDFITNTAKITNNIDAEGNVNFVQIFFIWYFIVSLILTILNKVFKITINFNAKRSRILFWSIFIVWVLLFTYKIESLELGFGVGIMTLVFYLGFATINKRAQELLR